MAAVKEFMKRAAKRVKDELDDEIDPDDYRGLLRAIRRSAKRERDRIDRHKEPGRRQAWQLPAMFNIPGSPALARISSAGGNIPFHFAKNDVRGREASAFDLYATGKAVRSEDYAALEERASEYDGYMADHGGPDERPPAGYTNLDQNDDIRKRQWRAIEERELSERPNAGGNGPGITFHYHRAPQYFDQIAGDGKCPVSLARLIQKEQRRAASGKPISDSRRERGTRWSDEAAFATWSWLKEHPLWSGSRNEPGRIASLSEGRAVQTHLAGEGEYHHLLSAKARARIQMSLVAFVQAQANDPSQCSDGSFIPMTIFDHEPDKLNDPRNNHFHFLLGTRRAQHDANGQLVFDDKKVNALTRKDWLKRMRVELARLTNIELAAIDCPQRFHAGTLKQMAVTEVDPDIVPMKKLNGRATVLERAGFPTEIGLDNDLEGWRRKFAEADRQYALRKQKLEAEALKAKEQLLHAARLRHEADIISILVEMTLSRPTQTKRYAPEYASAAKSVSATEGWASRAKGAAEWIAKLGPDLAVEHAAMATRISEAERIEALAATPEQAPGEVYDILQQRRARIAAPDAHRAVDIIAKAPLLISLRDGALTIDGVDDPDGLVADVDLGQVQARLAALRANQQRELAQVQAFARKHGVDALDDMNEGRTSLWLRDAARKWRDTPVMDRWKNAAARPSDSDRTNLAAAAVRRSRRRSRRRLDERATGTSRWLDDVPALHDVPFLNELRALNEVPFLDKVAINGPSLKVRTSADEATSSQRRARPQMTAVRDPAGYPRSSLSELVERPLPLRPTSSQISTALFAIDHVPLRLVDYRNIVRVDERDDPRRLLNGEYLCSALMQDRLREIWNRRESRLQEAKVDPDLVKTWRARGVDAFCADFASFEHIFVDVGDARTPSPRSSLRTALGPEAHFLDQPHVRARMTAAFYYQQAVREDILYDIAAQLEPEKAGRAPISTGLDRDRHERDMRLAREREWLLDGAVRHERRSISNRLFSAAITARDAGEEANVLLILSDAARAQPQYLDLAQTLTEEAQRSIHAMSSAPRKGIYFERPRRGTRSIGRGLPGAPRFRP